MFDKLAETVSAVLVFPCSPFNMRKGFLEKLVAVKVIWVKDLQHEVEELSALVGCALHKRHITNFFPPVDVDSFIDGPFGNFNRVLHVE